ncbi:hypothetical protein J7K60_01995 [Candidatus Bipolaricaulota bacterium]|nr:hypothetical protein [Candidatus Bipolaricaulota bacterium]
MWGYGMMGYGGWMLFWWIGGLFLFGALVYSAVRLGSRHSHRDYYDYDDCEPRSRDCRENDRRREDERYRRDER